VREIKFRAWDKKQNKMIYFHPLFKLVSADSLGCQNTSQDADDWIDDWTQGPDEEIAVLMQFTGIEDENDFEIYEGDVVLASHPADKDGEMDKVFAVVVYDAPSFYARYVNDNLNKFVSGKSGFILKPQNTLIGNIYQNPELLTKEKN
jgi:uncharacterized phage protein (TIGR01671 family)